MSLKHLGQKGFSLPEVMIAVGLLGGVSLITMKLVENQSNNENQLKARAEISKTVSMVEAAISNQDRCKSMFQNIDLMYGADGVEMTLPELSYEVSVPGGTSHRKKLLERNTNYGAFFLKATDIKLESSDFSKVALVDLVLNFRIKKNVSDSIDVNNLNNNNNVHTVTKRIPLVLSVDTSNAGYKIKSCGPVVSDTNNSAREKFCNSLGGATEWLEEPFGSGNYKCKLKSMDCPWGQVPSRMTSLGGVICKPAEDAIDPNTIFDTTPCTSSTNRYTIESSGGKLKVKCL